MPSPAQQFVTDQNLFSSLIWLLGGLGLIIVSLGGIAIRLAIVYWKSSHTTRKEMTESMEKMSEKLDSKFQNIDRYVRKHDLKHAAHTLKIDHLTQESAETKKKTERHAEILLLHEKAIAGIKP